MAHAFQHTDSSNSARTISSDSATSSSIAASYDQYWKMAFNSKAAMPYTLSAHFTTAWNCGSNSFKLLSYKNWLKVDMILNILDFGIILTSTLGITLIMHPANKPNKVSGPFKELTATRFP